MTSTEIASASKIILGTTEATVMYIGSTQIWQSDPKPHNEHEYVEIGGVKWATMNIGANSVTDTGLYFQWGDTQGYTASQVGEGEGQKYFSWEDYKYGDGTSSPDTTGMTKYNSSDNKTVLDASDDAAQAAWGNDWRMPTAAEFQALNAATTSAWTDNYHNSGVAGLICTDKTDSSKVLFFPATGFCHYGNVSYVGINGNYFSSSIAPSTVKDAYSLSLGRYGTDWEYVGNRVYGYPVRPVYDSSLIS